MGTGNIAEIANDAYAMRSGGTTTWPTGAVGGPLATPALHVAGWSCAPNGAWEEPS